MDRPISFKAWPLTARSALRRRGLAGEPAEEEDVRLESEEEEAEVEEDEGELEAAMMDPDVKVDREVDLDQGLREEVAWLPWGEVTEKDGKGNAFIKRRKVIDALLKRGLSSDLWERLPLEVVPWERKDCPNPDGEQVSSLAYGLESIVELRGKIVPLALMPVEQRRGLRMVAQLDDIDPGAMPTFVPPWRDTRLQTLALAKSCRFFSSTSSMTGLLSKCYFAVSRHRGVDITGLSPHFRSRSTMHGPSTRWPTVVYLRRTPCGQAWSISAAPEGEDEEDDNVLSRLGLTMEQQMKMTKEEFDARFCRKAGAAEVSTGTGHEEEEEAQAYRFLEVGPFLMRSQLDASHNDIIFDLKTRAVAPIRYDMSKYKKTRKYRIGKLVGPSKSYELEIYDMMRLAFLKYGFQARIGRMDGVFVTYHNTAEIFGFQYIPLDDMDRCIYGSELAATTAFDLSSKLLATLLEMLTEDPKLVQTDAIKVMLYSDPDAALADGNALDLAAAPVHEVDTARERLGTVRRWRVLVDVERPDGKPHPWSQPLTEDLSVHLSAKEVLFRGRREVARNPFEDAFDTLRQGPNELWRGAARWFGG